MEIIDTHVHLWTEDTFAYHRLPPEMSTLNATFGPADLKPWLDESGVGQVLLVQTYHTLTNTEEFLRTAADYDWIGGVVGWVNLADPGVGGILDLLQRHPKLRGIRHIWHDEPDPAWILRGEVLRGLKELERRGLPYDVLVRPPNWPYMVKLVEAVPDLPMVIDHIAKPHIGTGQFDDWSELMDAMAQFPNMRCKLSGMVTETRFHQWQPADFKPYVDKVIDAFGAGRAMYGSDWPVCLLSANSYAHQFDALRQCLSGVSDQDQARILGGSAKEFYGLN